MQQKISFVKGMRRNLSPTKQDPNSYYKAVNKSIVTDNVDSTGAISDEIGNKYIDDIIDLSGITVGSKILKMDSIRDWVVCFIEGVANVDRIVRFKIIDDTISDFTTIYSQNIFGGTNIETVFRYRDENFCKLYWVDGVNQLRSINIFDADSASIPLALLDATPVYATSQPKITKVLSGGMYKSGKVQYAYQLYNIDGSETVISPVSYAVPLSESSVLGATTTFKGSDSGDDTGKSVRISIDNIDSTFDYIKIISVHYEDIGAPPIINVVEEREIVGTSLVFTDTGATTLDVYTPEEFNFLGSRIIKPKSITTKDNHLIAANITEEYFDIDEHLEFYWDARTYRFKTNDDYAPLNNSGETGGAIYKPNFTLNGAPVPETHDAIQTKAEQSLGWSYNKSNVLGGEGPNIKYEFITQKFDLDYAPDTQEGVTRISTGSSTLNISGLADSSYAQITGEFNNYTSPLMSQLTSYMRGEMYRFGIVFVDLFGRHSFVKWIADIKMPDNSELSDKIIEFDVATDTIKANALGIKFTVDTTVIPPGFKWYIVRAKRTDLDKTILSQGALSFILKNGQVTPSAEFVSRLAKPTNSNLVDYNTLRNQVPAKVLDQLFCYSTPEVVHGIYNGSYLEGDKISILGEFEYLDFLEEFPAYTEGQGNDSTEHKRRFAKFFKLASDFDEGTEYTIKSGIKVGPGEIATIENNNVAWPFHNNLFELRSVGGTDNTTNQVGIGGTTHLIATNNVVNIPVSVNKSSLIVNYVRDSNGIYGGNTYNAKLASQYVKVGNLKNRGSSTVTSVVFGGDTYISMFDSAEAFAHNNTGNYEVSRSWFNYIPVETSINLDYVNGFNCSKNYSARVEPFLQENPTIGKEFWGNKYSNLFTDYYKYNKVYSREPDVKIYSGKPFIFRPLVSLDTRIIDSEKQIITGYLDNWTKFLYTSVQDLRGEFGSINAIRVFNNRLVAFQSKAIASVGFNDREVVQSQAKTSLTLGSSDRLTYHDYISETSGCIHNKSILNTGGAIYYFDGINKRFSMIGGDGVQGLSDITDMSQYFKNIDYNGADEINSLYTSTPKGAVTGYDPNLRKVYLSIYTGTATPHTISFNEYIRAFESEHTWGSKLYHTHKNNLLTIDEGNLYIQNKGLPLEFFGVDKTASVTFIVTGIPDMKKVLTNLEFGAYLRNSDGGTFNNPLGEFIPITSISASNSYQATETLFTTFDWISIYNAYVEYVLSDGGTIEDYELLRQFFKDIVEQPAISNLRRRFKTWRYQVPRESGGNLRLLDYFFYVTITNNNTQVDIDEPTALYIDDITAHYLIPLI